MTIETSMPNDDLASAFDLLVRVPIRTTAMLKDDAR